MKVLHRNNFKYLKEPSVITIGMFDGLHLGHAKLIDTIKQESLKSNLKSLVYTFNNNPYNIINKDYKLKKKEILSLEDKVHILKNKEIDFMFLEDFNQSFKRISPKDFIKNLISNFNMKILVVGYNFRFGYKNTGNINILRTLSKELGFKLIVIPKVTLEENKFNISSTNIRANIEKGNLKIANKMIGNNFFTYASVDNDKLTFTSNLVPKRGKYTVNIYDRDIPIYKNTNITITNESNFKLENLKLLHNNSNNYKIEFLN